MLPHQAHQLLVDDLHHGLARRQALQNVGADRPAPDLGDELAHHRQRHIRLEQRHAHVAQRVADVRLRQAPAPAQLVEGALKSFA